MKTRHKITLFLAAVTTVASTATAQLITYVDVTHGAAGNTARLDWNAGTETWDSSEWNPLIQSVDGEGTADDGLWAQRAFGNENTIYQNGATTHPDDAHPLLTTVSGLDSDAYDVFVYFWSSNDGGGTGSWGIRASLDGGEGPWTEYPPTTGFLDPAGNVANAGVFSDSLAENPFTTSVMIGQGNRRLYQAHLGQVTGTGFSIYIDDLPKTSTDGSGRTWYDGVGYSVVPEPSTFALLGLGALLGASAIRRRIR